MSDRAGVLVVGGGVIGASVAWSLARRGVSDVRVVDLDLAGIYASSELNAGGARATWWQPVNIDACRVTLDFFREHADEFGFRQKGYLWLYGDPQVRSNQGHVWMHADPVYAMLNGSVFPEEILFAGINIPNGGGGLAR